MTIIVFGNPDLKMDSLPVRLLPRLRSARPDLDFRHLDPNEEWDLPADITVIDTVMGLDRPRVFETLDAFQSGPRLTMHDFDAYMNLRLLMKLGRLRSVRIIGLPPTLTEEAGLGFCLEALPVEHSR